MNRLPTANFVIVFAFIDRGGPLVIPGMKATEDVQIGVVSWGIGCATQLFPGVYSRVSTVYDWIKETVCEKSLDPPEDLCGTRQPTASPSSSFSATPSLLPSEEPSQSKQPSSTPTTNPTISSAPSLSQTSSPSVAVSPSKEDVPVLGSNLLVPLSPEVASEKRTINAAKSSIVNSGDRILSSGVFTGLIVTSGASVWLLL